MNQNIINLKNNGRVAGIRNALPSIPMFTENNNKNTN